MICVIHAKEGRIFSPLLYFPSECAIILPEAPECRRSEIKLNKETSGAVFSAKDRSRETGKREAGESPARSRHCKQGARPLCHWETGKAGERGNGVRIFHRMNTASRRILVWNGMFPIKTLLF